LFLFVLSVSTNAQSVLLDIESSWDPHPLVKYNYVYFEPKTCYQSYNTLGFKYGKLSTLGSSGFWSIAQFKFEKLNGLPGVYYIKHLSTGKYLTVEHGTATPNTNLILENYQGKVKQRFRIIKTNEGYKIRSTLAGGLYVVEMLGNCQPGASVLAKLKAARAHNDDTQNFTIWGAK
jgi:hypothetical protein